MLAKNLLLIACLALHQSFILAAPHNAGELEVRADAYCNSGIYGELLPFISPYAIAQAWCTNNWPVPCTTAHKRKRAVTSSTTTAAAKTTTTKTTTAVNNELSAWSKALQQAQNTVKSMCYCMEATKACPSSTTTTTKAATTTTTKTSSITTTTSKISTTSTSTTTKSSSTTSSSTTASTTKATTTTSSTSTTTVCTSTSVECYSLPTASHQPTAIYFYNLCTTTLPSGCVTQLPSTTTTSSLTTTSSSTTTQSSSTTTTSITTTTSSSSTTSPSTTSSSTTSSSTTSSSTTSSSTTSSSTTSSSTTSSSTTSSSTTSSSTTSSSTTSSSTTSTSTTTTTSAGSTCTPGTHAAKDGVFYTVQCGAYYDFTTSLYAYPNIPDLDTCINLCENYPYSSGTAQNCYAVDYSVDSGQCLLLANANTGAADSAYDSAARTNYGCPSPPATGFGNGEGGGQYIVFGGQFYYNNLPGDVLANTNTGISSLQDCLNLCDVTPNCGFINYDTDESHNCELLQRKSGGYCTTPLSNKDAVVKIN